MKFVSRKLTALLIVLTVTLSVMPMARAQSGDYVKTFDLSA